MSPVWPSWVFKAKQDALPPLGEEVLVLVDGFVDEHPQIMKGVTVKREGRVAFEAAGEGEVYPSRIVAWRATGA